MKQLQHFRQLQPSSQIKLLDEIIYLQNKSVVFDQWSRDSLKSFLEQENTYFLYLANSVATKTNLAVKSAVAASRKSDLNILKNKTVDISHSIIPLYSNLAFIFTTQDMVDRLGYAILSRNENELELLQLAVVPEHRHQKIATLFLTDIFTYLRDEGCTQCLLEVRENNLPAISLYQKLNFQKIAIRKNFYENPLENALTLIKKL